MVQKTMRSLLFVPGNSPSMVANAAIYGSDAVVLDLEDSVPLESKDSARILIRHALSCVDYGPARVGVRINSIASGMASDDVREVAAGWPDFVMIPKVESCEQILAVDNMLASGESANSIPAGSTDIIAILETPRGILNAFDIARASNRIVGLAFGAEDFCTSMGIQRSGEGTELLVAKATIVLCSRATNIAAFDTVFVDIDDDTGLLTETKRSRQLGFNGKCAIHPNQVPTINSVFTPDEAEIEYAKTIVEAYEKGLGEGLGAVAVGGMMVDEPVVRRAFKVLGSAGHHLTQDNFRSHACSRSKRKVVLPRVGELEHGAEAGTDRKGDARINITPIPAGQGLEIEVTSKVAVLYGTAIRNTVRRVLEEMGVTDAHVTVTDQAALDFAIAARTEAAVRRATGAGHRGDTVGSPRATLSTSASP